MIDTLFTTIEDIYFLVLDDSTPEATNTSETFTFSNTSIQSLIDAFKTKAKSMPYVGQKGNQFKLLKLGVMILNYFMYSDDGKITDDELFTLRHYVEDKLTRLSDEESKSIVALFEDEISINEIIQYITIHNLPCRSIDMMLDLILDQSIDISRYFLSVESLYTALIEL
jgi:hypothetical protein